MLKITLLAVAASLASALGPMVATINAKSLEKKKLGDRR